MSAAEDHLQAVQAAQGETAALKAAVTGLKTHAEATAAAVATAFSHVTEQLTKTLAQVQTVNEAIGATTATGETHVEASANAGHGTHAYARAAKENCDNALVATPGVLELLESIGAALEEGKTASIGAIMAALAPTEDAGHGINTIGEQLGEAEGNITAAIHS